MSPFVTSYKIRIEKKPDKTPAYASGCSSRNRDSSRLGMASIKSSTIFSGCNSMPRITQRAVISMEPRQYISRRKAMSGSKGRWVLRVMIVT